MVFNTFYTDSNSNASIYHILHLSVNQPAKGKKLQYFNLHELFILLIYGLFALYIYIYIKHVYNFYILVLGFLVHIVDTRVVLLCLKLHYILCHGSALLELVLLISAHLLSGRDWWNGSNRTGKNIFSKGTNRLHPLNANTSFLSNYLSYILWVLTCMLWHPGIQTSF